MNEILNAERRDALIEKITSVAQADVLTNEDALVILEILARACKRSSAMLDEEMLKAMIEGEDPTPGAEE